MTWTTPFLVTAAARNAAVAACLLPPALLAACLSWFLQRCYEPGMIFRKYYSIIFYWFRWKARRRVGYRFIPPDWEPDAPGITTMPNGKRLWHGYEGPYQIVKVLPPQPVPYHVPVAYPERWWGWFFKPLGGCVYCQSIWVATALYAALFWPLGWPALLWWPPYCGAVYLFVSLLDKPLNPHQ